MSGSQVLVVEDERIVAEDIKERLERSGYVVPAIAASGEEALAAGLASPPDLVVMDVRLEGGMDGIAVAEKMRERLNVPIIYVTAYHSDAVVNRARATFPVGYLIKPLREGQLEALVDIALFANRTEDRMSRSYRWMSKALSGREIGIVGFDGGERIRFINEYAERMTGWRIEEAFGAPLTELIQMGEREKTERDARAILTVLQGDDRFATVEGVLKHRGGELIHVTLWTVPLLNMEGTLFGRALAFKASDESALPDPPALRNESVNGFQPENRPPQRILFGGRDPFVRLGFRSALSRFPEFRIDGEAASEEEVFRELARSDWDAVVLNCCYLAGTGGMNILEAKGRLPESAFLILCTLADRGHLAWAFDQGMSIFLTTGESGDLVNALREIRAGRRYLSPELAAVLGSQGAAPGFGALSGREKDVFHLIVLGKSGKEISSDLNVSVKTVSTYRTRILKKLAMRSTADLVSYALENGILA